MNILDRNEIQRIIEDLDCRAMSDLYLHSTDVHSFVIEDIEEKGRYILLHVNHHAQHTLMIIEQGGTTAGTHYTNYDKVMSLGELLGHELHSVLDLFLGEHNNDPETQRRLLKKVADDMLDGGPLYTGLYALFEATGSNIKPTVTPNQLALALLHGIAEEEAKSTEESDFSKRARDSGSIGEFEASPACDEETTVEPDAEGEAAPETRAERERKQVTAFTAAINQSRQRGKEAAQRLARKSGKEDLSPAPEIRLTTTLLPTASKLANLLIADSVAAVRCIDVRSEITNTIPSVTVAFHPDQTTAFIIIEHVGQVTIHAVDAVHYADGDRATTRWAPLYEMLSGVTETQEVTSTVREYIKCQVELGTLKST
jgi:hypothetical protein